MLNEIKRIWIRFRTSESPFRYLLSRILFKLRISQLISIKRDGYKIKLCPTYMSRNCFESRVYFRKEEEDFLDKYLKMGDTYVDIGANIGLLSLKAASVVSREGRVYAFEPIPRIFSVLAKNVEFNDFENIVIFNYALGDSDGEVYMNDSETDDTINSVVASSKNKVKLCTLDSIMEMTDLKINLLKVDVEGFELFVFRGAPHILQKTDCVFFESWEIHSKRYNYTSNDLLTFLRNSGFRIFKISSNELLELHSEYISYVCEDLLAIKDINDFRNRYFEEAKEIKKSEN